MHFAIDPDEVFMATKIEGKNTYWLPFNKGFKNGKGNPPDPNGYKTSYLWEEVLKKDSWMDIIQRFIHLQTDEIEIEGKTIKKEKLIFPRYHQLDSVRKITADAKEAGAGKTTWFNIRLVRAKVIPLPGSLIVCRVFIMHRMSVFLTVSLL